MIQRIRTALKRMKNLQRNQSDSEAKNIRHLNTDELEAGLEEALTSPTDEGIVNFKEPSGEKLSESMQMIRQISSSGYLRKRLPHELLALQPNTTETIDEESLKSVNVEVKVQPDLRHESKKAMDSLDEREKARMQGYEGDPCGDCGNFTLVRNGTCMKCNTCGSTSGCS